MSAGVPVKSRGGVMVKSAGGGLQDNTWKGAYGFNDSTAENFVRAAACQSNGKIICLGKFTKFIKRTVVPSPGYIEYSVNGISRLRSDGTLDSTFNRDSSVTIPGILGNSSVVILDDDAIVCAGDISAACGVSVSNICRLDKDGFFESSYGTGINGNVYKMLRQDDNKIICVGDFTDYNGTTRSYIVRINDDESIDTGFNAEGLFSAYLWSASLFGNGNIMCIGGSPYGMKLLSPSGNIISSFNYTPATDSGWFGTAIATACIRHSNGSYYVAEQYVATGAIYHHRVRVCKLNSNGTYTTTKSNEFVSEQIGSSEYAIINDLYETEDGDILCVGDFTKCGASKTVGIARLNESLAVVSLGYKALYQGDPDRFLVMSGIADQHIPSTNKNGVLVFGRYLAFVKDTLTEPYTPSTFRYEIARINTDLTIDKYPGETLE